MSFLEAVEISKSFGGIQAVDKVSFSVEQGKIASIIGPNGAGKTTLFNIVTGVYAPTEGMVYYQGNKINGLKPFQAARLGITRTFQNLELFSRMSVLENVMVGQYTRTKSGLLHSALRTPLARREEREAKEAALCQLELVGLLDKAYRPVTALSFGEQRLVEIARAIAMEPSLLLLDEPAAGLNTAEKKKLVKLLQLLRAMGITIVLVDHDMDTVMELSDQVIVLYLGKKIADGTAIEVQQDKQVIAAYLGGEVIC